MAAVSCVLVVFIAGAIGAWFLRLMVPAAPRLSARQLVLDVACLAVWFVPLGLFLRERSALGMAMAAVLAAAAILTFSGQHRGDREAAPQDDSSGLLAEQVFVAFHARSLIRDLLPALFVVVCAEVAGLAQMIQHSVVAAGLSGASSAMLARSFAARVLPGDAEPGGPAESKPRPLWMLALVLIFTIIGLLPFLRVGLGFGSSWSSGASRPVFYSVAAQRGADTTSGSSARQALENMPADLAGYSGIVLWPKYQQIIKLVAPPVPAAGPFVLGSHAAILNIPFHGVYWIFKAPDSHPPKQSHVANGSPEEFNIRSTDGRPLRLEAHQNLATLINLGCCSRIQVAIRNTDRYPGTVSLELILRNTTMPGKPSQSLGTVSVASTRPWRLYGTPPAVSETLDFNIPLDVRLRQFDDLAVVFRLSPGRSDVGARIGIERFTLVVRGP